MLMEKYLWLSQNLLDLGVLNSSGGSSLLLFLGFTLWRKDSTFHFLESLSHFLVGGVDFKTSLIDISGFLEILHDCVAMS